MLKHDFMETQRPSSLPDVAQEVVSTTYAPLDWVGMTGIEVPVWIETPQGRFRQAAKVDAQVSLDLGSSRGIHMSRLYLIVQTLFEKKDLTLDLLSEALNDFLKTHTELSSSARIRVRVDWPLLRSALVSGIQSWRNYPVILWAEQVSAQVRKGIETVVTYSSTCPASAALSRRLIQEGFRSRFQEQSLSAAHIEAWLGTTDGIQATPHAQRSLAHVVVEADREMGPGELIDWIEEALRTAVQGAVKREDEQAFAYRNGQNLMFCEDSARRVREALERASGVRDYYAEMKHLESLHPHNAVAVVSKGLKGGLSEGSIQLR